MKKKIKNTKCERSEHRGTLYMIIKYIKTKKSETWYEYLREENKKEKQRNRNKNNLGQVDQDLKGFAQNKYGGHRTHNIKAIKGSTFGPASEGRSFSPEEIQEYENDLRLRGLIT